MWLLVHRAFSESRHSVAAPILAGAYHGWEGDGKKAGDQIREALKASLERMGLHGSHSGLEDGLEGGKERLRSLILLSVHRSHPSLHACVCFFSSVPIWKPGLRGPDRSFRHPTDFSHSPLYRIVPGMEQTLKKCLLNEY